MDSGLAVVVYLAAYLLMTLLSFLILVIVSTHADGDDIVHFNGLGKRSPFLAFGLLVAMMSLAGVPLTAGFLGKFLSFFKVAFETGQFSLIALGILTVGCGFYFYLKVVRAMYWQPAPADATAIPVSRLSLVAMWIMVGLIFVLGIFPQIAVGLLPTVGGASTGRVRLPVRTGGFPRCLGEDVTPYVSDWSTNRPRKSWGVRHKAG